MLPGSGSDRPLRPPLCAAVAAAAAAPSGTERQPPLRLAQASLPCSHALPPVSDRHRRGHDGGPCAGAAGRAAAAGAAAGAQRAGSAAAGPLRSAGPPGGGAGAHYGRQAQAGRGRCRAAGAPASETGLAGGGWLAGLGRCTGWRERASQRRPPSAGRTLPADLCRRLPPLHARPLRRSWPSASSRCARAWTRQRRRRGSWWRRWAGRQARLGRRSRRVRCCTRGHAGGCGLGWAGPACNVQLAGVAQLPGWPLNAAGSLVPTLARVQACPTAHPSRSRACSRLAWLRRLA